MKYFSMFSGVGGFEYGIEQAIKIRNNEKNIESNKRESNSESGMGKQYPDCECVGFSEIDKYAIQTYQKHYPDHLNFGDCTKIEPSELPYFDMLCGGFPCQAFSIAGKRRGFEDTRGTLFFDVARILRVKRPKLVFLENVKGLLNHDKGKTFSVIIQTLEELGYECQWMVLNSKFFGVPQNRERVFIIGSLRGEPRPEILPFRCNSSENNEEIEYLNNVNNIEFIPQDDRVFSSEGVSPPMACRNNQGKLLSQAFRIRDTEGVSSTLQGEAGGTGAKTGLYIIASRGRNPNNPSDRTTGSPTEQRLEANSSGTTNTLSSVQKDNMLFNNSKIRRLTPTECERLQGFPDNWTEGVSDTQRYKQLGNAVTTKVITAIMGRL